VTEFSGNTIMRLISSFLLGLLSLQVLAADLPPDQLARSTTQEVLAILKADKDIQSGSVKRAHELVEAKVLPHFDFNRMTQLAVGKHWTKATPQQKQALVKEFRSLLVRTYATSLTEFSNQSVDFKPLNMRPDDTQVTVKTEIKQPGGKPIPIDYEMYKTDFGWKVFDVAIDGVSLVINYRSSFASTIRQSGIDGLISTLEAKSRSADKEPAAPKGSGDKPPVAAKPSASLNHAPVLVGNATLTS
jgi:phospholipid transport system substrate-binding protein